MTIAISGTNGITLDGQFNSASSMGFKNRIINGAMVIDQRNAGASVTPSNQYVLDRWYYGNSQASKGTIQQNAASVTPPTGFSSYLGFTSSSAYSVLASDEFFIRQPIEGFNSSDLAFGSASATSITLSFWVRSSLTGTFAGVFKNSAQNRSYPFTYTISSANTWEQKTVTIVGDTSGTWIGGTNGVGLYVVFALGAGSSRSGTAGSWQGIDVNSVTGATSVVGTNGATFYITGVQLEKGSTATSFDYRPYGTELALCQRYYFRNKPGGSSTTFCSGYAESTTVVRAIHPFPVSMRTAPTALEQSGTASDYAVRVAGTATVCSAVPAFNLASTLASGISFTVASGLTAGNGGEARLNGATSGYLAWSAEL